MAQPMPKSWHDWHAASAIEDPETRRLYQDIVADRKPYFMRYIYPDLMKQYNKFVKNTNRNACVLFDMSVDELKGLPVEKRTAEQVEFLRQYDIKLPVGTGSCVMNRICRKLESIFDGSVVRFRKEKDEPFDYSIMKSGCSYSRSQFYAVKRLYDEYTKKLQMFKIYSKRERVDPAESTLQISAMREDFINSCSTVCSNRFTLCDIVLDMCYTRSSTKKFVWDVCGDEIIENLLRRSGGLCSYPCRDSDGPITYGGERFSVKTIQMEVENESNNE